MALEVQEDIVSHQTGAFSAPEQEEFAPKFSLPTSSVTPWGPRDVGHEHDMPQMAYSEYHPGVLPQLVDTSTERNEPNLVNAPPVLDKPETEEPEEAEGRLPEKSDPGLTKRHKTSTTSLSPTPTSTLEGPFGVPTSIATTQAKPSICNQAVCPPVLSFAQVTNGKNWFLFGLGNDNAIWYREAGENKWLSGWTTLGGSFKSQPAAISSKAGRVDVFSTWSDGSIRAKTYQGNTWAGDWLNLGGESGSAPAVASPGDGTMTVLGLNSGQEMVLKSYNGTSWQPSPSAAWTVPKSGYLSASPVGAASPNGRIDIVSYGSFDPNPHDLGWIHITEGVVKGWEGNALAAPNLGYAGDPTIISTNNASDAFGIGTNNQVYQTTWTNATGYGKPQTLGGAVKSTPFVLATDTDRLDALAISTSGNLIHKARINGAWAPSWEDLGGFFNSAPLAVQPGKDWVAVWGLGPTGTVIHGNWSATNNATWGAGQWFDDGGNLTMDWFRAGPA
ncbi:hypothetical protein PT974_03077 [Cladobotryum mycophilum]|uniref:PLL-like beta propeller domain-containing protein n=1 Tax=Cladobotryum mycophilum TaxID=491253 RepID=A0ABR0SW30_9HYPO